MNQLHYIIGYLMGALCTYLLMCSRSRRIDNIKIDIIKEGIDPDELIAWIENQSENYEYLAPPTAGEITKKIREMQANGDKE